MSFGRSEADLLIGTMNKVMGDLMGVVAQTLKPLPASPRLT